ncbi:hypothetical protein Ocin01_09984 [Orchesella cincta]|uniref:Uncharacterized protein n=1 Tax=Orchesella cincta TaxID=48709 RepID=A0A1D2MV35_ORCCI|nr:hypothetical protein Ocin01_09984 [Orchesella cincta]
MKFLYLTITLIFAVIMANGEMEEFSTTVKPTKENLNSMDTTTIKYSNEIESSTTVDKVSDMGSIVPMEHAPCEDICVFTLNCSEWNHCAYHHPDHCLGLQLACTDDDKFKIADEETITEISSCYNCSIFGDRGANFLCVLHFITFVVLLVMGVRALINFLVHNDDDEPVEESAKRLKSWKDDKKAISLDKGNIPITMIV